MKMDRMGNHDLVVKESEMLDARDGVENGRNHLQEVPSTNKILGIGWAVC